MTLEEAREWAEANKKRIRESLSSGEEPPADLTPDGVLVGPQDDLSGRRHLRDVKKGRGEEE